MCVWVPSLLQTDPRGLGAFADCTCLKTCGSRVKSFLKFPSVSRCAGCVTTATAKYIIRATVCNCGARLKQTVGRAARSPVLLSSDESAAGGFNELKVTADVEPAVGGGHPSAPVIHL